MFHVLKSKCVTANLLLAVILLILLHNAEVAFAQYCEAPTIFENGVRKSTQITVHFKEKVFDLPRGVQQAQISDMASSMTNVRQHFSQLEQRYSAISFVKVIADALWGEVWQRHKSTGQLVRIHDMSQLFFVKFARFVPIDSIIAALQQLNEVEYAHRPIEAISLANPNDPFYQDGSQWNLTKIDAAKAWDITTSSSTIVVGIIEDGQYQSGLPNKNHQDFWTGSGSTGQSKFESGKGDTGPSGYHATQVAGIIGAATNDGDGVASLGWNIQMIPYRFNTYETGPHTLVAKINQARTDGCDVINCSFVTRSPTATSEGECLLYESWKYPSVDTAIADAISAGIVVVAGTGNAGAELTSGICDSSQIASRITYIPYPANYPNVIGVSATDVNDIWAGGRAYNNSLDGDFIDVAAPGIDVKTATSIGNNTYAIDSGTSFSSAHGAALAGLIKSLNPQISVSDVINIVRNTAVDVNQSQYPGYDAYMGYGRINAYQALLLTHAYSNKSVSSTATAGNNGRRIVKDGTGIYHMVFESGITSGGNVLSEIFYRRSNVGGTSWDPPVRLSAGDEQNRYPSIAEQDGKLYVVWQRKAGTNTYDISFRHYNGSAWETIQTITSGISVSSDPLPAIAISTPSASFETMVAYRTGSGLKSKRSTSTNGSSWQSEIVITSNTSARNPSLSYNEDFGFVLTWDNGSNVYHQYFSTSWSSPVLVSRASLPAFNHQYSSNAASGNMDRHIAWQAFEADLYQRQVIYYNRNLNSTNFTMFVSENDDYLRPTITGHTDGAASVVWHDASSNHNIRKAYYNGASWADGQTGTVIVSNGADASLSITNPYGGTAKAVWRSAGTAPYTLTLGPSSGLGKSAADEIFVYNRRAVYAQDTTALFVLQMSTAEVISAGRRASIPFPVVADDDSLVAAQLADKLRLSNISLPVDADSVVFTVHHYSRDAGRLRQNLQQPLQVDFVLLPTTAGATPITISLGAISPTGESRQATRMAFPAQSWRNQTVNLQSVISNLDVSKSLGTLIHVYAAIQSGVSKSNGQPTAMVTDDQPGLALHVHPNPFNPSAQIRFDIPAESSVALRIYNLYGQLVRELLQEYRAAGEYTITWDGRDDRGIAAASGVYFVRFEAGNAVKVSKAMLVR